MPNNETRIKIAKSFDSASQSYDVSARLQRFCGKHLLLWLPENPNTLVLDLGCGTGFFTDTMASCYKQVIGVDISMQMLNFTKTHRSEKIHLMAADAYKLPFIDNSFDCIYSNLVIQWCTPLSHVLTEIKRVLKPGGQFIFSTLTDGTLAELKSSWSQVDNDQHVIDFKHSSELQALMNNDGFQLVKQQERSIVLEYQNVLHLAHELKGLGANHVPTKKNKGLAGKDKWQKMTLAYQDFIEPNGIYPATYNVFSGAVVKTDK